MQLNRWLQGAGSAAAEFFNYVEDHWYAGQASSAITFHPSIPESNPLVRGYAKSAARRLPHTARFPAPPAAWTHDRAA